MHALRRRSTWILCLLLGAVATLASARIPAAIGPSVPTRHHEEIYIRPIATMRASIDARTGDAPPPFWAWFGVQHRGPAHATVIFRKARIMRHDLEPDQEALPAWARVPTRGMRVDVHAYAWPFAALRATHVSPSATRDDLTITPALHLPLDPIPLGLALDVLVWGLAVALLGAAFVEIRGALRRARGRCQACAYDRRGIHGPCPECGESPRRVRERAGRDAHERILM